MLEPRPQCRCYGFRVPVPAMTSAGISRPRVLLSGAAEVRLTTNELQTALRHEVAHVRRRDNLKKLLLRFVAFPAWAGWKRHGSKLRKWRLTMRPFRTLSEALDLAAALIKLSRLGSAEPPGRPDGSAGAHPAASTNARVERLVTWSDERLARRKDILIGMGHRSSSHGRGFGMTYSQLLVRVHTATEWLVR